MIDIETLFWQMPSTILAGMMIPHENLLPRKTNGLRRSSIVALQDENFRNGKEVSYRSKKVKMIPFILIGKLIDKVVPRIGLIVIVNANGAIKA